MRAAVFRAPGLIEVRLTATNLFDTLRFFRGEEAECVFARLDAGDIVGSRGRLRIGNSLFPELCTLDPDCSMAPAKRPSPATVVARSGVIELAVADLDCTIADPWGRPA